MPADEERLVGQLARRAVITSSTRLAGRRPRCRRGSGRAPRSRSARSSAAAPRPDDGRIALVGRTIRVALEDVEAERRRRASARATRAPRAAVVARPSERPQARANELPGGSSACAGSTLNVVSPGRENAKRSSGRRAASSRFSHPAEAGWWRNHRRRGRPRSPVLPAAAAREPGMIRSMDERPIALEPAPAPGELPDRFPSPFATPPHPLARAGGRGARRASSPGARSLAGLDLDAPAAARCSASWWSRRRTGGSAYLRAFSGMLDGRWDVDGFVPPLFDRRRARRVLAGGRGGAGASSTRAAACSTSAPSRAPLRGGARRADAAPRGGRRRAREHRERDTRRRERRAAGAARGAADEGDAAALHTLDQEEPRRHRRAAPPRGRARRRARRAGGAAAAPRRPHRRARPTRRAERSRDLLRRHPRHLRVHQRARRAPRRCAQLFAPDAPPGGAGDCAAPKLLVHAYRARAAADRARRAVVGRAAAHRRPPRRRVLPGVPRQVRRRSCRTCSTASTPTRRPCSAPAADRRRRAARRSSRIAGCVVVDKPCGLLSVPGRSGLLRDSVADPPARAAIPTPPARSSSTASISTPRASCSPPRTRPPTPRCQRQFARREIDKRYVAWLDGDVAGDRGVIELALRVDLDDRPRQLHDPVARQARGHRVAGARARAAAAPASRFAPAHRPHPPAPRPRRPSAAASGAPIVGDRLYGRDAGPDGRLHAARRGARVRPSAHRARAIESLSRRPVLRPCAESRSRVEAESELDADTEDRSGSRGASGDGGRCAGSRGRCRGPGGRRRPSPGGRGRWGRADGRGGRARRGAGPRGSRRRRGRGGRPRGIVRGGRLVGLVQARRAVACGAVARRVAAS